MGLVTLHSGLTEVNSERTAKGDDRRGDFMGVHRFQIWHTKHPVLAQRDDSGPVLGSMGLEGFCFPAIDSRSGTQRDDSGPVVADMGLHGFCFAAIDSGVTLGPVLETWVLRGYVLLPSIPDPARQTSCWGSTR